MTSYDWALLLHLVGAIGFFSGLAVASAAQLGAWRRDRYGEVAALLGLARWGVLLVGAGLVLVVASGFWLVDETRRSLGDGWIVAALLLLLASLLLGAAGGRRARHARVLAASREPGAPVDRDVLALLRDRASLASNLLASAAALGVLVLMVWRPE